jgi:hypothetical protein
VLGLTASKEIYDVSIQTNLCYVVSFSEIAHRLDYSPAHEVEIGPVFSAALICPKLSRKVDRRALQRYPTSRLLAAPTEAQRPVIMVPAYTVAAVVTKGSRTYETPDPT